MGNRVVIVTLRVEFADQRDHSIPALQLAEGIAQRTLVDLNDHPWTEGQRVTVSGYQELEGEV